MPYHWWWISRYIERVLPSSEMRVQLESWPLTREWQWLFDHAGMDWDSFIRVFNAGYGFCIIMKHKLTPELLDYIERNTGDRLRLLGRIV